MVLAASNGYFWQRIRNNSTSVSTSSYYTATLAGSYKVVVTASGCRDTSSAVSVSINPNPTPHAGPDVTFTGTPINLGSAPKATGGSALYTYFWNPSTGLNNSTLANPAASPSATTPYFLTVTDANGCTASDDVTVNVPCNSVYTLSALSVNLPASGGNCSVNITLLQVAHGL